MSTIIQNKPFIEQDIIGILQTWSEPYECDGGAIDMAVSMENSKDVTEELISYFERFIQENKSSL